MDTRVIGTGATSITKLFVMTEDLHTVACTRCNTPNGKYRSNRTFSFESVWSSLFHKDSCFDACFPVLVCVIIMSSATIPAGNAQRHIPYRRRDSDGDTFRIEVPRIGGINDNLHRVTEQTRARSRPKN